MSQTLLLNVPDMTCGHCQASVEKALSAMPGVTRVSVDLPAKRVSVEANATVSVEQLAAALDEVGFTGEVA